MRRRFDRKQRAPAQFDAPGAGFGVRFWYSSRISYLKHIVPAGFVLLLAISRGHPSLFMFFKA